MSVVEETPAVSGATRAADWPREQAELVELPSGASAVLRRPQLSVMIRKGEIPNPLLEAAAAMSAELMPESLVEAVELTDLLVSAAFVEPRVALEDAGPDELPVEALSDQDKAYVAAWVKRDVAAMATFRGERPGADRGEGSGAVRDAA